MVCSWVRAGAALEVEVGEGEQALRMRAKDARARQIDRAVEGGMGDS
jgi:hypothetical protein